MTLTVYMNLELLERGDLPITLFLTLPHVYIINCRLQLNLSTPYIPLKVILRHFFFSVTMISQVLLFREIMHCKFLVFLLIVFLFFLFFLSSYEFWLIERIGAHGKQNPDFIIVITQTGGWPVMKLSLSVKGRLFHFFNIFRALKPRFQLLFFLFFVKAYRVIYKIFTGTFDFSEGICPQKGLKVNVLNC